MQLYLTYDQATQLQQRVLNKIVFSLEIIIVKEKQLNDNEFIFVSTLLASKNFPFINFKLLMQELSTNGLSIDKYRALEVQFEKRGLLNKEKAKINFIMKDGKVLFEYSDVNVYKSDMEKTKETNKSKPAWMSQREFSKQRREITHIPRPRKNLNEEDDLALAIELMNYMVPPFKIINKLSFIVNEEIGLKFKEFSDSFRKQIGIGSIRKVYRKPEYEIHIDNLFKYSNFWNGNAHRIQQPMILDERREVLPNTQPILQSNLPTVTPKELINPSIVNNHQQSQSPITLFGYAYNTQLANFQELQETNVQTIVSAQPDLSFGILSEDIPEDPFSENNFSNVVSKFW